MIIKKKICENLLEKLFNNEDIRDEEIYEFLVSVEEIINQDMGENTPSRQEMEEQIPSEYYKLKNYIEFYWRCQKYESDTDTKRILNMGRLLSITMFLEGYIDSKYKRKELLEDLENKYNSLDDSVKNQIRKINIKNLIDILREEEKNNEHVKKIKKD